MFDFAEAYKVHDIITTQSSVFVVIVASNDKYYQLKIPSVISNPITSEYLAYKIGKNLNLPLLHGAFIDITYDFFNSIISQILQYDLEPYIKDKIESCNIDRLTTSSIITLFAIEWIDNSTTPEDNEDLEDMVNDIILNEKEFYSVYSFDMLLCNFDRHCKNFIIDNNTTEILFIDHEKSFGSEDYSQLNTNKTYENCVYYNPSISYMYDFIKSENQFENIIHFSNSLDTIDNSYIENIFDDFENYSSDKFEFKDNDLKNNIKSFFNNRIGQITNYININKGDCFDSISQS